MALSVYLFHFWHQLMLRPMLGHYHGVPGVHTHSAHAWKRHHINTTYLFSQDFFISTTLSSILFAMLHHITIRMCKPSFVFLSILAVTLTAAQIPPDYNFCTGDKSTLGHCDTLTYVDTTLAAKNPPNATECQEACSSIFQDAGEWVVHLEGRSTTFPSLLVSYTLV